MIPEFIDTFSNDAPEPSVQVLVKLAEYGMCPSFRCIKPLVMIKTEDFRSTILESSAVTSSIVGMLENNHDLIITRGATALASLSRYGEFFNMTQCHSLSLS